MEPFVFTSVRKLLDETSAATCALVWFTSLPVTLWHLGRQEEAVAVWTDAVRRNANLSLASNQLAGAKRSLGRFDEAAAHENQADQSTPDNPPYHWMLGLRLKNLGMNELAEKHFRRAIQLDPGYETHPK